MKEASFEGRSVIVTGGAGALGRAMCRAFAAEGARVLVADLSKRGAQEVAHEIGGTAFRVDVTSESSVADMVDRAEALGPLIAAINNAGTTQIDDDVSRIMAVNLTGARHCMKHQLRVMRARGEGAIVNVSSNAAIHPGPGQPLYTISKAALLGLTRSVARLVARDGVRVNALCPGSIETPMLRGSSGGDQGLRFLAMTNPSARLGTPEEVAKAALWLCNSSFVVGHALVIDGGAKAW